MWTKALKRVKEVSGFFGSFDGTFLKFFVEGINNADYDRFFQLGFFPNIAPKGLKEAVRELPESLPNSGSELSKLAESIRFLIDDFIEYIDFVEFCPKFVFAVRSLLNRRDTDEVVGWLLPSEKTLREWVG